MKKVLVLTAIAAMFVLMTAAVASAAVEPLLYDLNASAPTSDWAGVSNGVASAWNYMTLDPVTGADITPYSFPGFTTSTHPYGTWNSPYTTGIDGYNYNDPQGYTESTAGWIGMPFGYPVGYSGTPAGYAPPFPANPPSMPFYTGEPFSFGPYTWSYGFMLNPMMDPDGPGPMVGMWFPVFTVNDNGTPGNFTDDLNAGSVAGAKGPHGTYKTTTHKCRDCHAVHRASGKFKLTRADNRADACDWCHGSGAGSGFNIEMDNDDAQTKEYNVGHSLGFGLDSGKWKAPDDTNPAYTPHMWLGGFSCLDCHSPHANPERILGYIDAARVGSGPTWAGTQVPGFILDSGSTNYGKDMPWPLVDDNNVPNGYTYKPLLPGGKYILIENPDVEKVGGVEVADTDTVTTSPSGGPVNKMPISWNFPFGTSDASELFGGQAYFNMATCMGNAMSEFCADCHDGNTGLHIQSASMFSEDRALRATENGNTYNSTTGVWSDENAFYDIGYSHDNQPRHCGRQMVFNPEDADEDMVTGPAAGNSSNTNNGFPDMDLSTMNWPGMDGIPGTGDDVPVYWGAGSGNFGPHCRNCHRGGSRCDICHENLSNNHAQAANDAEAAQNRDLAMSLPDGYIGNVTPGANDGPTDGNPDGLFPFPNSLDAAFGLPKKTAFPANGAVLDALGNTGVATGLDYWRHERTVYWNANWRTSTTDVGDIGDIDGACSDDGFSWPHRTLGWKMLKDELWGLDFDGDEVAVGATRDGANGMYSYVTTGTNGDGAVIPTGIGNSTATIPVSLAGPAHDLDSSCLDCHNPTIWNPSSYDDHVDDPTDPNDNFDDELILRGLP